MIDELRARLRRRFSLARDEPDWCGVVLELAGERQAVVVKPTVGLVPERIIVAARVGPERSIEPALALRYNAIAQRGALALEQETYVLRELVAADADLEPAIEALAHEAARLRRVAGDGAKPEAFGHYAD